MSQLSFYCLYTRHQMGNFLPIYTFTDIGDKFSCDLVLVSLTCFILIVWNVMMYLHYSLDIWWGKRIVRQGIFLRHTKYYRAAQSILQRAQLSPELPIKKTIRIFVFQNCLRSIDNLYAFRWWYFGWIATYQDLMSINEVFWCQYADKRKTFNGVN